jgi:hypothetical protein
MGASVWSWPRTSPSGRAEQGDGRGLHNLARLSMVIVCEYEYGCIPSPLEEAENGLDTFGPTKSIGRDTPASQGSLDQFKEG